MPEIALLDVADRPQLWVHLGFSVIAGCCWVSDICFRLGAAGRGVTGWTLEGADANGLDEFPSAHGAVPEAPATSGSDPASPHPNGVSALDHLVIAAPDLPRTIAALETLGLALRRTRDAGSKEQPLTQAFFRTGRTILEVVGSEPARPGPTQFWGLAFTTTDFDATVEFLGDQVRPPKAAVQSGRRIATLDRAVGSTVPIAFMSESTRQKQPRSR
ncbi:MAG TPA: VOC family protein [Acidimicrobiales bacterium]|nr:VOC family protein [Acidimicrobiales bacterium]